MSVAEIIEWPEIRQWTGEVPAWISPGRPCLILTKRMVYLAANGQIYIVPAGYITDLASVPVWLWWLIPPHGELMTAAILHDWLYSHGGKGMLKATADDLFLECCQCYSVTSWKRKGARIGVGIGGRGGWANGWHAWPPLSDN